MNTQYILVLISKLLNIIQKWFGWITDTYNHVNLWDDSSVTITVIYIYIVFNFDHVNAWSNTCIGICHFLEILLIKKFHEYCNPRMFLFFLRIWLEWLESKLKLGNLDSICVSDLNINIVWMILPMLILHFILRGLPGQGPVYGHWQQ